MPLRVGQRVPDFSLPDVGKRERRLSEFFGRGGIVLAFFPFAFSGTSDRELCVFRDGISKLDSTKSTVIAVSVDSVFTLKVFAQTYGIEFPLLSDFNKKVSRTYGVLQEEWVNLGYKGVSKGAIFVIDMKGILRYRWSADAADDEPPYELIASTLKKIA